jgi:hypothetical protein
MTDSRTPTGCCPVFDPSPWEGGSLVWNERPFLRDRLRCLLYFPLGFGKAMTRNLGRLEQAGALTPDNLVLAEECSPWRTELYFAIGPEGSEDDAQGSASRLDPGAKIETLSGTFRTEVFDGPYKDAGRWRKQLATTLAAEGHEAQDIYAFYTTCPRCAKVYGHNYVVLLARV